MKIKNYRRIKELSDLGWKEEREPHPFLEATPKDVVLFLDDYHVVISFRRKAIQYFWHKGRTMFALVEHHRYTEGSEQWSGHFWGGHVEGGPPEDTSIETHGVGEKLHVPVAVGRPARTVYAKLYQREECWVDGILVTAKKQLVNRM